jgi:hypothetical protein
MQTKAEKAINAIKDAGFCLLEGSDGGYHLVNIKDVEKAKGFNIVMEGPAQKGAAEFMAAFAPAQNETSAETPEAEAKEDKASENKTKADKEKTGAESEKADEVKEEAKDEKAEAEAEKAKEVKNETTAEADKSPAEKSEQANTKEEVKEEEKSEK